MSLGHSLKNIRNFSIIAHIDHGKSSIADRLLEFTGTVSSREIVPQLLDDMDLERERGITIKAHVVSMNYSLDGKQYLLNLIDTPGHVDFSYEVSRSLAACEGAIVVVDASQGVQAQTIANVFLALENNVKLFPVLNKVDLPAADIEGVKKQIEEVLCLDASNIVCCSAKTGIGINELLSLIVNKLDSPEDFGDNILRALIFDSHYDVYRGVLVYIRVMSGSIKRGDKIRMLSSGQHFEISEVGIFSPKQNPKNILQAGEVGYFIANIKKVSDIKIGETVVHENGFHKVDPLPGFKVVKPSVFAGIYPSDPTDYLALKDALSKLQLNDSALSVEQESSNAIGMGFRCGFLGLLHFEIVFERIQREFDIDIISTSPGVVYEFVLTNGTVKNVDNPSFYPDPSTIDFVKEPWVIARILSPSEYLGPIMNLSMEKRGELEKTETVDNTRLLLTYKFPLNEIIIDFSDRLKSVSKGYASFDYDFYMYKKSDIVKLEIRINKEVVDSFSRLVHREKADYVGRSICKKLLDVIPKHLFKIPIQASVGGKIVARETINALAKDVTAKCYGGDITRKRKLWDKQKEGKKKMKEIGKVSVPQKAFLEVLKMDNK